MRAEHETTLADPHPLTPTVGPAALGLGGPAHHHRIVVAMSGGVDSSLAAALIARAGYDTIGITLQLYDYGASAGRKGACCAGQDIHDARRVAERIGIPHYVLNYEDRFRSAVIDAFADSYLAGETPIPCVRCNQTVKFSDLLATARELGASALVTGHYVRSRPGASGWELYRAADAHKDQSYFLFATTKAQLDFLRFPLGSLTKSETRSLAARFALPVAEKPDSQDICFVPSGDYTALIRKLRPDAWAPGEIVHADGRVLGRHDGVVNFTVGQRKGLGLAIGEPLFVLRIQAAERRVIVGPRELLGTRQVRLRGVNWIGEGSLGEACRERANVCVKVRSTQALRPATLIAADSEGGARLELSVPEFGVAAGQACVFYDRDTEDARVLGGGFIVA